MMNAALLLGWFCAIAAARAAPCRDRFLEPFSADSIWNTAIGSGAVFKPANLYAKGDARGPPGNFHNDQDFLIRGKADDPLTDWVNQGSWGRVKDHCAIVHKGKQRPCGAHDLNPLNPLPPGQIDGCVAQIRLPRKWTSATDCDGPATASGSNCRSAANQPNNNAMALLLADNVSLVQMQPAYRCGFYPNPLLARWGNATDGGPQRFPNVSSILGDGTFGAHGGSGLSSIGGSVRLGELLPHSPPIAHALKIELANWWYYGGAQLNPATPANGGRDQYVWPATGSNQGFCHLCPGGTYNGTNEYVAPGALLAIPAHLAARVKTTTVIGGKIKQAMVDYGAYIVDGTGHGPGHGRGANSAALCMDAAVNAEMRKQYGFNMAYPHGVASTAKYNAPPAENAVYEDLLRVFQALHAVSNNGPSSVGGGGTPRRPRKGPICGA